MSRQNLSLIPINANTLEGYDSSRFFKSESTSKSIDPNVLGNYVCYAYGSDVGAENDGLLISFRSKVGSPYGAQFLFEFFDKGKVYVRTYNATWWTVWYEIPKAVFVKGIIQQYLEENGYKPQ